MTDDVAAINRARWNALVEANVEYARPMLELTPDSARAYLDPMGLMGDVKGKQVLCLASGGGQQSVAYALLGADVTVFDLSDNQLARDRQAAAHYGLTINIVQGDMRHLDAFAAASFDLVDHPHSINFVPQVEPVFAEVARVIRPRGFYRFGCFNPFAQMIDHEHDWNGSGYLMRHEYVDGRESTEHFPTWSVKGEGGEQRQLDSPREFVHSLSTIINTLASKGFVIVRVEEYTGEDGEAPPGSWNHFARVAAPYLTLSSRYLPNAIA